MTFSKSLREVLFSTLIIVTMSSAIALGLPKQQAPERSEPINGLQISISKISNPDKSSGLGEIRIDLHNSGEKDFYTIPGMLQDCGVRNLAGNVKLTVVDANGTALRLAPPFWITCGGAREPFIVSLPSGTTISIPVDLDTYHYAGVDTTYSFAQKPAQLAEKLKSGFLLIRAEFTGTTNQQYDDLRTDDQIRLDKIHHLQPSLPFWTGTVRSNTMQVSFRQ